jgi:hypothetical protein
LHRYYDSEGSETNVFYSSTLTTSLYRKADGDWQGFVDTFKALNDNGILEKFVNMHSPAKYWGYAHNSHLFLLWHRVYTKEFEKALQEHGAKYIPYWNWAIDSTITWRSPVLLDELFGRFVPRCLTI